MVFTQGPLSLRESFGHERGNASETFSSDGDSGTPSISVQAANLCYDIRDTYIVRFVAVGCRKNLPLGGRSNMDANPYSAPSETGSAGEIAPGTSRVAGAVIAALVGVPTSGVWAYLLFGWCAAIGSAVISDDTWDTYSPKMFVLGALCGILPCVSCGFLNPERPILAGVISHSLGLLIAAILATAHFRWPVVMGCYAGFAFVLPVFIAAARRPTWFLR